MRSYILSRHNGLPADVRDHRAAEDIRPQESEFLAMFTEEFQHAWHTLEISELRNQCQNRGGGHSPDERIGHNW